MAWRITEGVDPGYTLYDIADRLRVRGWQVPAYPLTGDASDVAVGGLQPPVVVSRPGYGAAASRAGQEQLSSVLRNLRDTGGDMPIEERRRLHLYEAARERLGVDAADTLMELLPPMDPSELATKTDLALTRSELRGQMAEIRREMAELRTELKGEMAELRVAVADMMREQTNRLVMFVVPTMLTAVGLSFAASQLAA
ncbi:MAG: hypothetical protein SGJ13_10985 [Actinomycetota bacterium]|nr:hypothetical protein [Actinomycetota bacterium]